MMVCEDNVMRRGRKLMVMMTSDGLSSRTGGGDGEWWMVMVDVEPDWIVSDKNKRTH